MFVIPCVYVFRLLFSGLGSFSFAGTSPSKGISYHQDRTMISSLALRLTPLFISSSRRAIFSTGYRAFSPFLGPRRVAAAEDNRRPFYKNNYLLSSQMSSTTDIAPLLRMMIILTIPSR